MVAACLYYICKEKKIPITFQEILNETPISEKKVKSCYRILINSLNLKAQITNPIVLIPKFITKLGLSFEVEKTTIKILESFLKTHSIGGLNPKGICAGAIYSASKFKNVKISQKRIGDIVGVADATIRTRYKTIKNLIDFNILK